MQDSNGFEEIFSHTDRDGDPVTVGRDRLNGAYIMQERGEFRATTYVKGVVPALARALYQAEGLEWPAHSGSECRAFYSPDPATQYRCWRAKGHAGPHMDDTQNTLWVSGWQEGDSSGYRFIDARSDADKLAAGELPPAMPADQCPVTVATGSARVRCELGRGHSGEHDANGYTWPQTYADFRSQTVSCGVQLTWDQESEGTAQCVLPAGHTGLHGLGPNSGDYLSGRPVEEVVLELLRRISSLEQVTGRHSASLSRAQEPVSEDVRQTLRGIGRGITAVLGKLERLGAEPVKWVTQIGEIADGVETLLERTEPEIQLTQDMLSEVAEAMDQVMDAGGHVYDQPVQLRCDVHDWCVLDRGHRENCSELR